jgi:hypothetical protein
MIMNPFSSRNVMLVLGLVFTAGMEMQCDNSANPATPQPPVPATVQGLWKPHLAIIEQHVRNSDHPDTLFATIDTMNIDSFFISFGFDQLIAVSDDSIVAHNASLLDNCRSRSTSTGAWVRDTFSCMSDLHSSGTMRPMKFYLDGPSLVAASVDTMYDTVATATIHSILFEKTYYTRFGSDTLPASWPQNECGGLSKRMPGERR